MNKRFKLFNVFILIFLLLYICMDGINVKSMDVMPQSNYSDEIKYIKYPINISESKPNLKVVFLTFDDGPSHNTKNILRILNDKGVKATFFVIGKKVEESPQIVRELKNNGMCILPHTYSHEYKIVYKSVDGYFNDLNKCKETIKKIVGVKDTPYVRMPGGSDNLVCSAQTLKNIKKRLCQNNMDYVDWNVSSSDAAGLNVPAMKLRENVKVECKNTKCAIILMHDSYYKETTTEALPEIIDNLKSQGYIFKTFDNITPYEIQTMKRIRVINR